MSSTAPINFDKNDDYPGGGRDTAVGPTDFPRPQVDSCARITTRVYHPTQNKIATVKDVLVKTMISQKRNSSSEMSVSSSDSSFSSSSSSSHSEEWNANQEVGAAEPLGSDQEETAYWLQRTLREAIYGKVKQGVILRRRLPRNTAGSNEAEWEVTDKFCAVKEMSWSHIQRHRGRLAEDPITEVSAMHYLAQQHSELTPDAFMAYHHVVVPLDLLSDERCLYSVLPYCNGGELFDRLEQHEKFSEQEARYWMRQLLKGIDCLHGHGICHRDISLENLLVNDDSCVIIDLGMCLRIPVSEQSNHLRLLMQPQGTCGKWHYMSPEIALNREPFDGFAVDMWAAGVILFLMLTGFPPWERPLLTDDRFRYMTAGYLAPMLTEWKLELSPEAMDLLQRMLWHDARDRLSLRQVRAHPWILNDDAAIPDGDRRAQQPWA